MTKKEYIEKYGEEAWKEKLEKDREWRKNHNEYCKEYQKHYRAKNRDKLKEYHAVYSKDHKSELLLKAKEYYADNKEQIKERTQKYYEDNKDTIKTYWRKRYEDNKGYYKAKSKQYRDKTGYNKKYRDTKEGRANHILSTYNSTDRKKGQTNNLTQSWIIEHILNSKCIYCGESDWHRLGCDRIDNNLPHTQENCICACGICNCERNDTFTVEEFIQYRRMHPRFIDLKPDIVHENGITILRKKHIYKPDSTHPII